MATKIYTKTGDSGQTGLFGGKRLSKNHIRIDAYGTVDELNSYIGLIRDTISNPTLRLKLKILQDRLFDLGSVLSCDPDKDFNLQGIIEEDITFLEEEIDSMTAKLPALKNFILPGGHTTVSFCHIARCVCRRAERKVVALAMEEEVDEISIRFLNRLSDFLFVLARKLGKDLEVQEVTWQSRTSS